MIKLKYTPAIIIIFFVIVCLNLKAFAQQTIINVPSSEVLPFGGILLKDSNRFSPFDDGYATITPSATFGLGHGFELSTGVATTLDKETFVRGDITAKKVWFIGNASRLTVGGTISPYLSESSRPNSFVYSHFTHRIKKTKTSITAGLYLHGKNSGPDSAGAILGLEQVIIPNKLRLALDWLSSEDSYGKMGVGLKYRPVPTLSLTSAVIVPNEDDEIIGFNFSLSKFISVKDFASKRRL